ncbi:MAG: YceI family protein [Candidatus Nomurabacteria bacterium GW2011_GWB1_37_5]|uniref:YceI family protein n=1 Tax=Candidatus Nomurabacteria bacterium GW2011_GWB1_37_5 TaxID=1618742 RepID=A0A0G0K5N1_9BACT|nr:MAG: YceI family protein [Candidatus Nomurabacteria bacterium GW2011_GWB1_37_5]
MFKKIILILVLIVLGVFAYKGFNGAQTKSIDQNNMENLSKGGNFEFDAEKSVVRWQGKKTLILNYVDQGTIKLKSGFLTVEDGKITSGDLSIDMSTVSAVKTGKGEGESFLSKHLMSPDFFDAEKYPTADFKMTKAEVLNDGSYKIDGVLTIKGITKPISILSKISMADSTVKIEGKIELDRTEWDVRYGSGKFFQNLGDAIIGDMFTLEFDLVANIKK